MKKLLYFFPSIVLILLSSCYRGQNILEDWMIGDLKTEVVSINEADKTISFSGYAENMHNGNLWFQIDRTGNMESSQSIFLRYDDCQRLPLREFGGTYCYRMCAINGPDTVYSSDMGTFTIDNILSISEPKAINQTSFRVTSTTNYQGTVVYKVSSDKEFFNSKDFYAEMTDDRDSKYEYSAIIYGLEAGTTYYVKAIRDVYLGPLESDVISFRTADYLRMGDVTYTGWDGKTHPMTDGYDFFNANYMLNGKVVARGIDVTYTPDGWKLAADITPTGNGVLFGYYTYGSPDSNDVIRLQTYKYDNPRLMWGVSEERNGVFDINFRNMLARVVLYITVSDDYPIDKPVVENFTIAGNTLPTIAGFDVNTGDWAFNQYAYSEPLGYWREVGLCKGETVEVVLYSIPCEKGMATATFNFWQNKYQSEIEIGWEAGKTYEYNVNVNTAGLSISDVKLKDWVPNEVGSIIINP